MTGLDERLAALAEVHGVTIEYWDWQGHRVDVPAAGVRAVLAALGVDASTPGAVERALTEADLAPWRRTLPGTVVAREGTEVDVPVHVDHGDPVVVEVELESGERRTLEHRDLWVDPRLVDGRLVGRATVVVPHDLPPGWHRIEASTSGRRAEATLVVTPWRLADRGLPDRAWGILAQIYQLRSNDSWGVGDLHDLSELCRAAAGLGADFVLVNPLHAAEPVAPLTPSPYLPTTRRYPSPLYLRVSDVPELADLPAADRLAIEALEADRPWVASADQLIDRDTAWTAKREVLQRLFRVPLRPDRSADLARFRRREGLALERYAAWCALAERHGPDVSTWPPDLAHPASTTVARLTGPGGELEAVVEFHVWLQWLLDAALERAQKSAREHGLTLGIVHDLAVGVHPQGCDAWALQDVLVPGCRVGAPPDAFNQLGQDWSQPPWHPGRLAETGYEAYREMLRGVLRHAGGVRVDHVMGLFRLWWIPEGVTPEHGTYVRYDHEAMLGILLLEAERAGCTVVGEDLGVVEPWVRDQLADRGVLGTSVLWFERGWAGEPLAPGHWRRQCLASVTTHDLPPTAGYLRGEHLQVRERLGLLTRPFEVERAEDEAARAAVLATLVADGLLDPVVTLERVLADDAALDQAVVALHGHVARTPARLLGVALADLVGDRRAVNQPGTDQEYPNWRIPLTDSEGRPVTVEHLLGRPALAVRIAEAVNARREGGH